MCVKQWSFIVTTLGKIWCFSDFSIEIPENLTKPFWLLETPISISFSHKKQNNRNLLFEKLKSLSYKFWKFWSILDLSLDMYECQLTKNPRKTFFNLFRLKITSKSFVWHFLRASNFLQRIDCCCGVMALKKGIFILITYVMAMKLD